MEIYLRKIITRLFLQILKAKASTSMPQLYANSRVILVTLNRIGDALITTSFIKVLKEKTGCSITLLTGKNNHFVFDNNPHCDDVMIYNKGITGLFHTVKKINRANYDVIIDLHDDVSTTVTFLVGLSKIKFKCGLKKGNEKIYTHSADKLDPVNYHVIDRLMRLADVFGINYNQDEINAVYECQDNSIRKAEDFITDNFEQKRFIAGINISAGSDARFWGVDRFKELCNFLQNYNINLILISAQKDLHFAEKISAGKVQIFCSPSFDEFAAMISKLNFLFTPDTSAVHLASAHHIPVFGIYARYGTKDMIWSPYKSEFEYLLIDEPDFSNLEYDKVIEEEVEESTYIEYFVADPDILEEDQVREPVKITIEYIASGKKDEQSESKRRNFYSKLDNMKTMNEVLGDLRSYKDRLFALDFKKEEKVNNKEKSKE